MLAEHAQVIVSMFHYHFGSKELFLRALLQQIYEEWFTRLSAEASLPGTPLARLRQALVVIGRFLRDNGAVIGRVWADAGNGEAVALDFVRANAPRHLALLLALLDEAERGGHIVALPALQRVTFVMGAVAAPVLVAARVVDLALAPAPLATQLQPQVLSDAAMGTRADLAIAALRRGPRGSA
jgi:AcrR family transcriptional regulator